MGGQEPVKTEKYFSTGLLAHVDAGKTTLSEALLYLTGAIRKWEEWTTGMHFLIPMN